jgi:hypothetical protein
MVNNKNGRAGVVVAVDGEEEALVQNALAYRSRGPKATKVDLKA